MKMRAIGAALMVLALGATPVLGQDGSIDLFPGFVNPSTGALDPAQGTDGWDFGACQVGPTTIFGGFGTKYIIGVFGRLGGLSALGIAGAQMYIDGLEGLPAGYVVTVTYPGGTTLGRCIDCLVAPYDDGGVIKRQQVITFNDITSYDSPNCQKDPLTFLAQIDILYSGAPPHPALPNDLYVSVVGVDPAIGALDCPLMLQCDYPAFSKFCVTGGQLIINPDQRSCAVAVSEANWGAVKALYR